MPSNSIHPIAIVQGDRFLGCNAAFEHALGYRSEQLTEFSLQQFFFQDSWLCEQIRQFQNFSCSAEEFDQVWLCNHADGDIQPVLLQYRPHQGDSQLLSIRFIQNSSRDPISTLPNGWSINIRSERFFQQKADNANLGYLILKVDHFASVNYRYGYDVGDHYLEKLAQLIKQTLGKEWLLVRYSGSKFGLLFSGEASHSTAEFKGYIEACCQQLCRLMTIPIELDNGLTIKKSISIGASTDIRPYKDFRELDMATEAAFLQSRRVSRSAYHFAKHDKVAGLLRSNIIVDELPQAVDQDQLDLVYQPLFEVRTRKIVGFEALTRWHHPTLGNVSPLEFIKVAEDTGFNREFDLYTFGKVCRQVVAWRQQFQHVPTVAVNFSAKTCESSALASEIATVLLQTNCPAKAIEIEITETAEIGHKEDFFRNIDDIRQLGVQLVLDDFGEGYSSMHLLRQLTGRISKLKVDRKFIHDVHNNPFNRVLFKQTIELSRLLEMKVLAEGIEDEAQMRLLQRYQCDYAQGYHLQRPSDKATIEHILHRLNTRPNGS